MSVSKYIEQMRQELGDRLLILGHHYQQSQVLRHADYTGDSLELARVAASVPRADRIVFCGVRFMAESADILSGDNQLVYMPEVGAGCPMADMVDVESLEKVWELLCGDDAEWTPVVYVNSSAEVKAFCGLKGGSACTSSNAVDIIKRELDSGKKVLFVPDEHLGTNCAHEIGLSHQEYDFYEPEPVFQFSAKGLDQLRMLIWRGYCHVHTCFTEKHIEKARSESPGALVIVHPETPHKVASLADETGSTAQIIKYIESLPEGSTVYVGTERNLVERIASQNKGRVTVKMLASSTCTDMSLTDETSILKVLEKWPDENTVQVPHSIAVNARLCLEKMLQK